MPLYDFSCSNHSKPYEFEQLVPLSKLKTKPKCPKCNKSSKVKKIIKKAFPVSKSWRTS